MVAEPQDSEGGLCDNQAAAWPIIIVTGGGELQTPQDAPSLKVHKALETSAPASMRAWKAQGLLGFPL